MGCGSCGLIWWERFMLGKRMISQFGLVGFLLAASALVEVAPRVAWAQSLTLEPIATGLARPVDITHAGDGSGRLFIVLQSGRIVIHDGSGVLPTPFLDISSLVSCCRERGLLGLAFDPEYATNGLFYVNYTNTSGDTVIARYAVSSNPDQANPDPEGFVLTVTQPYTNHNGGQIRFGLDGYLYIAMGDGGGAGDPDNYAQNRGERLGKMLRIDVSGALPYTIPPDNPFVGDAGTLDEIWALGMRNPWRFSFDRVTGDLFIADVGQGAREEVSFQPGGSHGGENYGWRRMEGSSCFDPPSGCDSGSLVLPIIEYGHGNGDCSITGGYRYRGQASPHLFGLYFYADFCTGRIWAATEQGDGSWTTEEVLDTANNFSTFGEDEDGELYIAHLHNTEGIVFRIVDEAAPAPPFSGNELLGSFSPAATGLWVFRNNSTWVRLNNLWPDVIATGQMDSNPLDEVIGDFGPGVGVWIWRNDAAWERLNPNPAESLVTADLDSDGRDEVIGDFGPTLGLWARFNDSTWVRLNGLSPGAMATGQMDSNPLDEVIGDFGPSWGVWIWRNNTAWERLNANPAENLVTGDLDSDGRDEVIGDFGPALGLWARFNDSTWRKLNNLSPGAMTVADMDGNGVDEVVGDFGPSLGVWVWRNNTAWEPLNPNPAESLVTSDLDSNGKDEVIGDFGPDLGLWARFNDSTWVKLNSLSPQALASGNIDGK